jgi:hypothetical protein
LSFFPIDETMRLNGAASFGSLLYSDNKTSKYEHLTEFRSFEEHINFIIRNGDLKEQDLFVSNGLEWFCYIPSEAKVSDAGLEMKICITEKQKDIFYQMTFFFDEKRKEYFSEHELNELIKSFRFI